jgi:uncharacterized protein YkwD
MIILMSLTSFGKGVDSTMVLDKLTFDHINQYREFYGVSKIVWSDDLYKTSVSHTDKLIKSNKDNPTKNTLYHSGSNTYENCMIAGIGGSVGTKVFFEFTKKYFNLTKTDIDSEMYKVLVPIWSWHKSPKHKENMLKTTHKVGSVHVGTYSKTTTFSGKYTYTYTMLISTSNFK